MVSRSECSGHRGSLQLVTDAERKTDKWPEAEGRTERGCLQDLTAEGIFWACSVGIPAKKLGLTRKIYGAQHPAKIPSHNLARYFK